MVALILDGQRQILPVVEELLRAKSAQHVARASMYDGAAMLLESRWAAPSVLVLSVAVALVLLRVFGVEVGDLVQLADVAAHAWTGEPHRLPVTG